MEYSTQIFKVCRDAIPRAFHNFIDIGHWFRQCPRCNLVFQIELEYVSFQPRVSKVCYDYKDNHFSRNNPQHRLVSLLGLAYITQQVKVLGICYDYIETSYWSNEGLLIIYLTQISLIVLRHLQLEVVHLVPQLVIQKLSLSLDQVRFVLLLICQVCDFKFYLDRCAFISCIYPFI